MAIVVASAEPGLRRGVIIVQYNYAFPLLANQFDFRAISERYHIVLEPSWTGFCNEDILCLVRLSKTPVFIESVEPRDNTFLDSLKTKVVRIPVAGNWWVDHRIFIPDPRVQKDLDFVMVAAWADFKRHHHLFQALRTLRRNGHRLCGACAGYPSGLTLAEIIARADLYGVRDQIEFHESVSREDIARLMNRAKSNVLWSRKEGFNRVVIEGMFCDVPCIIREGHNYGDDYPYINEHAGCFSSERELTRTLLRMSQGSWAGSPVSWVREHMTPKHATANVERAIRNYCTQVGELPPESLSVKTVALDGMEYWNPADATQFAVDYNFLRKCRFLRRSEGGAEQSSQVFGVTAG